MSMSTTLLLHPQTDSAASYCLNCKSSTWSPPPRIQLTVDRLLEAGKKEVRNGIQVWRVWEKYGKKELAQAFFAGTFLEVRGSPALRYSEFFGLSFHFFP